MGLLDKIDVESIIGYAMVLILTIIVIVYFCYDLSWFISDIKEISQKKKEKKKKEKKKKNGTKKKNQTGKIMEQEKRIPKLTSIEETKV